MRNSIFGLLVLAALAVGCGQSAPPPDQPKAAAAEPCQLNLFIWSEYIDPEIVKDFETQYSCKVTTDLYEDNESMMAKLQGGGTALYDVVVPGQYIVGVMARLGLLQPLNHANIPNIQNLDDAFNNPAYDPGNKYSVAYQWGTIGIYMRKKPGQQIDESWSMLFDPKKQPGPFLLMDSIREMLGTVLRAQGKNVNTTDPDELRAARDLLLDAKRRSQGFEGGVGGKNKVRSKDVVAAVVYNGDAERDIKDFPDTYFFLPREGGVIWVDNLVIPAHAPHLAAAEKFLNFILDPQIGARLSNFNRFATPNKAAKQYLNPEDVNNIKLYPTPEEMAKLQFVQDLGDNNKLYDEIWTQLKSK
ncbi:MAG: spermidine/putrescine ABC transporter substrate-binding protein [Thermoanaerobaculia bacterium]